MKRTFFAAIIFLVLAGATQGGTLATWDGVTLPSGGGGSMVYPTAGTAISSGSAWATSVINNTGAVSDIALAIGQKAYITASGATSIPLHIATAGAVAEQYEITLSGTDTVTTSQPNVSTLQPNNTTYSNAFNLRQLTTYNSSVAGYNATESSARITADGASPEQAIIRAWTTTTAKRILTTTTCYATNTANETSVLAVQWQDTTTVWSSLGTISLPVAWTGAVTIERKF